MVAACPERFMTTYASASTDVTVRIANRNSCRGAAYWRTPTRVCTPSTTAVRIPVGIQDLQEGPVVRPGRLRRPVLDGRYARVRYGEEGARSGQGGADVGELCGGVVGGRELGDCSQGMP
jgi:hypothetical protein